MRTLAAIALAVVLAGGACGETDADDPTLAEWTPQWIALRDLVPDADRIDSDGTDVCGDFLGEARTRRNEVIPTPDESLEEPVAAFVAEAETIGLDCDREGDLTERLDDLAARADEIDARIDLLDE